MTKLPKLKIKTIRELHPVEEVRDFEQAKYLFAADAVILVEGYRIVSYEELVQLASQETYRNYEFLEVVLLPFEFGGGG